MCTALQSAHPNIHTVTVQRAVREKNMRQRMYVGKFSGGRDAEGERRMPAKRGNPRQKNVGVQPR